MVRQETEVQGGKGWWMYQETFCQICESQFQSLLNAHRASVYQCFPSWREITRDCWPLSRHTKSCVCLQKENVHVTDTKGTCKLVILVDSRLELCLKILWVGCLVLLLKNQEGTAPYTDDFTGHLWSLPIISAPGFPGASRNPSPALPVTCNSPSSGGSVAKSVCASPRLQSQTCSVLWRRENKREKENQCDSIWVLQKSLKKKKIS